MSSRRVIQITALAATLLAAGWLWVPVVGAACGYTCVLSPTPSNPNCKLCLGPGADPLQGCEQPFPCRCLPYSCKDPNPISTPALEPVAAPPQAPRCEAKAQENPDFLPCPAAAAEDQAWAVITAP